MDPPHLPEARCTSPATPRLRPSSSATPSPTPTTPTVGPPTEGRRTPTQTRGAPVSSAERRTRDSPIRPFLCMVDSEWFSETGNSSWFPSVVDRDGRDGRDHVDLFDFVDPGFGVLFPLFSSGSPLPTSLSRVYFSFSSPLSFLPS